MYLNTNTFQREFLYLFKEMLKYDSDILRYKMFKVQEGSLTLQFPDHLSKICFLNK